MRARTIFLGLLIVGVAPAAMAQQTQTAAGKAPATEPLKLPYVYTKWKQFTVKDGLPNDHLFAVRAHGNDVWVGTEDGLALIDKAQGKVVRMWKEKDGLPWRAVTAIEVDPKTGDVWLGLFGGGLARLSGDRFDHYHQLNSGLLNDVVYGVAVEHDNIWAATTAGCSRYNLKTGEWTAFTEKNAPMEEIWNYNVYYDGKDKVYLAVWGSGVLVYDLQKAKDGRNPWEEYLDPDGEMEIDLYRDDGINHVIVTGAVAVDDVMWVSTYFGGSRYDGRHWRGYAQQENGLPSDFNNNIKARSGQEAYFCSDKGLGAIVDGPGDTWVVYTRDPQSGRGKATVKEDGKVIETVDMEVGVPHSFMINADIDGNDIWVATAEGLGWGIGEGYYPGLKERPLHASAASTPAATAAADTPVNPVASPQGR
jgi:ligand-binding sensor domain-containing protein